VGREILRGSLFFRDKARSKGNFRLDTGGAKWQLLARLRDISEAVNHESRTARDMAAERALKRLCSERHAGKGAKDGAFWRDIRKLFDPAGPKASYGSEMARFGVNAGIIFTGHVRTRRAAEPQGKAIARRLSCYSIFKEPAFKPP